MESSGGQQQADHDQPGGQHRGGKAWHQTGLGVRNGQWHSKGDRDGPAGGSDPPEEGQRPVLLEQNQHGPQDACAVSHRAQFAGRPIGPGSVVNLHLGYRET